MTTAPKARVLLVDDSEIVRTAFTRSLSRHGFEVEAFADADAGVAAARNAHYDLLITDLEMDTKEDGYAVIDRIEEFNPLLARRSVIVTGHVFTDDELKTKTDEGYRIQSKSESTASLVALLGRLLEIP